MKEERVNLPQSKGYPILIGKGILPLLGKIVRERGWGNSIFLLTHPEIYRTYGEKLSQSLEKDGLKVNLNLVPSGEKSKSLKRWLSLLRKLFEFDQERKRKVVVVNLGGGVVGDLGGFLASTYRRGIGYIQIPTTLLAQVDSSIGGKVGVDYGRVKNMVGAFYQPLLVFTDIDFLSTLPEREFLSGMAEVVKYGVIKDRELFLFLEKERDSLLLREPEKLEWVISRCSRIKAKVVEEDEYDREGKRVILNFGHTIGHALEGATGYKKYTHGEAISIGMVGASLVGKEMGMFKEEERLRELLSSLGLPTKMKRVDLEKLWKSLQYDKKFIRGKIRMIIPQRIGEVKVMEEVEERLVWKILKELQTPD